MVTIIIPVYRTEKYITKCIESIINQTYKDFEIVFIDDGTDDSSCSIINKKLNKTPNIKYKIINQENKGVSAARNVGIIEANGDYVVFIDSDDVISNNFLATLVEGSKENNVDVSICNYKMIKSQEYNVIKNNRFVIINRDKMADRFLLRNIRFILPTMLIKKDLLIRNNVFFDEGITFSEDQLFIWNVILISRNIAYVNSKLYGYYLRPESTMTGSSYYKISKNIPLVRNRMENIFCDKTKISKNIRKYSFPRWELGTLYTAAKILEYNNYKKIYEEINGKHLHMKLKGYNDSFAIVLAQIARNKNLFYCVSRLL